MNPYSSKNTITFQQMHVQLSLSRRKNSRLSLSKLRPFRDPVLAFLFSYLMFLFVMPAFPRFVGPGYSSEFIALAVAILVFPLAWLLVRGRQVFVSKRIVLPVAVASALALFFMSYGREGSHPNTYAFLGFLLVTAIFALLRFQAIEKRRTAGAKGGAGRDRESSA